MPENDFEFYDNGELDQRLQTSDSGGTATGTLVLSKDDDLDEPLPVPQTCNFGEECESCQ